MAGVPIPSEADRQLAGALDALASVNRILLLRQLQSPQILTQIRLPPEGLAPDEGDLARPIARQAVKKHLAQLLERGFIGVIRRQRPQGEIVEYVLNQQRIYRLLEELKELATLRPEVVAGGDHTVDRPPPRAMEAARPRLLVVRGLWEGRSFSLSRRAGAPDAQWMIGRGGGSTVRLDYDPFVSIENTLVSWTPAGYAVADLPGSRNGTALNYQRLEPGKPAPLRHGDVLTVGRTSLLLQTEDPAPDAHPR